MFAVLRSAAWPSIVLAWAISASAETQFFVDPQGADRNPGTREQPFATPARAQQAVRQAIADGITGSITVNLRGGRYELSTPLVFTSSDAGNDKLKVTWRAESGETPVLSGGRIISGWTRVKDNHWSADLPEVREGRWQFRQLIAGERRLVRARFPNADQQHLRTRAVEEIKSGDRVTAHRFEFDRAIPAVELAGQEAEFIVMHHWSSARQLIAESGTQWLRTVNPAGWVGHSSTSPRLNGRAYLEGAREFLDQPGEWYLDTKAGVVHYLAAPGEDPAAMQFVAPVLEQIVRIEGTREQPVRGLSFEGLIFRDSTWALPSIGYNGIQAAVYGTVAEKEPTYMVPGAIYVQHAVACSFARCRFAHTGATALAMGPGCRNNLVTRCEIADVGGNGFVLGWQAKATAEGPGGARNHFFDHDWPEPADAPRSNRFTHNRIHHVGAVQLGSVGYGERFSTGSIIAHNEFHSLPYTAISAGFIWKDKVTSQRGCTIEQNHIHHCMLLLNDGGAVYTLGAQPGTVLRNNYIHDIPGGHGLYTDEGSSYIRLENNVVSRAGMWGYQHNGGHDNLLVNNIIYNAGLYAMARTDGNADVSFSVLRNIIVCGRHVANEHPWYQSRPGEKGEVFEDKSERTDNYTMDNNLFWDPRDGKVLFNGRSLEAWRELGHDRNSLVADPLFADAENGNFALAPDSPAFKLGFQPIDLSKVGPQDENGCNH